MNNEQCTIEYDTTAVITGACEPSQYEHPKEGLNYDPEWISCSFMSKNLIYCFHPSQGHENSGITDAKEITATTAAKPQELPKSGCDSFLLSYIILMVFVAIVMFRKE
jgi:hypothetical protein